MHHDVLSNLKFCYMRVAQERREPYAIHFVSAKKYAIVVSNVYMTIYTMLNKFYQIRQFSYFCEFPKICLIFGEEYINEEPCFMNSQPTSFCSVAAPNIN